MSKQSKFKANDQVRLKCGNNEAYTKSKRLKVGDDVRLALESGEAEGVVEEILGGYFEPWVSYTKENEKVDYNYKPKITLRFTGDGEHFSEKTYTLEKFIVSEGNFYLEGYGADVSCSELWNMLHTQFQYFGEWSNVMFINSYDKTGQLIDDYSNIYNPIGESDFLVNTDCDNLAAINNIICKANKSNTWETLAEYVESVGKFVVYDESLFDGKIEYEWNQQK